jgi:uncharacterized glyoxalase superfamily protein PhnB
MPPRFDAIGLVTRDMGRALAFYRQLGLDIPDEADGQPHVEAALPGGLRLMWDTEEVVASFAPGPLTIGGSSLAFLCDDPADVDATYERLVAGGAEGVMEPFDAPWGQRYAVVHDPDGNGVDLFASL